MSLTVKAFLARDGQWDAEIRRFQVPADVSSSYVYLRRKVCDMFPSLREGNVSMFWKDNDGDAVAFSTDDELTEALGHVTDGIFKINVAATEDSSVNKPGPRLHPGVICDGCEGPVSGPRYKCLVCPNFDLCKVCEKKGLHPEHNKMKIAAPGLPVFPILPFGPHGFTHGPRGRGHHGPHGLRFIPPPPPFRRWMQRYMKQWHKRHGPKLNSSGEEAEKTDGEEQHVETTGQNVETNTGEVMESGESGESTDSSGEEGIEEVGECIADMMTAVGIDSDDNAEKGGQTETQETKLKWKHHGHHGKCKERKMFRHGPWKHAGRRRRLLAAMMGHGMHGPYHVGPWGPGPWAHWETGFGEEFPCPEGPCQHKKCCKKWKKNCRKERGSSSERHHSDKEDSGTNKSKKHFHKKEKRGKRQSAEKSRDQEDTVMILDNEPSPQTVVLPSAPRLYPEIPRDISSAPPVTNPHSEALKQLLAMGFKNDGGWLARLVEAKNGDVTQVLDAIKPQK